MKRSLFFILLLLLVLPSSSATTYTCCKNFETSNGTVLNSFENFSQWVGSGGIGGTSWNNTINYKEGYQSILISTDNSTSPYSIDWTLETPVMLNGVEGLSIWMYIENKYNTSEIAIYFSNTTTFTKYVSVAIKQGSLYNLSGWQKFYISNKDPSLENHVNYGGMLQTDYVKKIRIRNLPVSGKISNVSVDNLRSGVVGRAKAIIVFDDGWENVYQNARNILKSNNQKATVFVVTGFVGTTNYMNLSALHDLEDNYGWDISSHTQNHSDLTLNTTAQIRNELRNSQNYLTSNSFSVKSSKLFAYPYGAYNNISNGIVKENYSIVRTTELGLWFPQFSQDEYSADNVSYTIPWTSVSSDYSESKYTNYINDTIHRNGTIVLSFHQIVENGTVTVSTQQNISTFMNISNYLAARSSDIDVITFSDYLIASNPSATEIKISQSSPIVATSLLAMFIIGTVFGLISLIKKGTVAGTIIFLLIIYLFFIILTTML